MNKIFFVFSLSLYSFFLNAQDGDLNMKIIAHVDAPEGGSGVWHYFDKDKNIEYAVLGSQQATVIYSLEDPAKPKERFRFKGGTTLWREVFSYGKYVYAVTDVNATDGLAIIDMTKAPDTIKGSFWRPFLNAGGKADTLGKCHTVFVDEKGILSLNGCTPWAGTLYFDLNPNPKNPKLIGSTLKRYCHDNFARRDTIYSSEINDGKLTIYNAKDYSKITEVTGFNTPNNFNHNSWLSDDSRYIFTTDERADAFVASYDISDLKNIKLLDKYKPKDTEGTGVVPHNVRYLNGYLITSYYTDGVKIIDAHKPDNLIEVGSVDTYKGAGTGFQGCWGVSPFLPSGTIVASNINDGLYIIQPTYSRACYLEGLVTDTITGVSINNVSVKIKANRKNEEFTDLTGQYKSGYAIAGDYDIEFSHNDYFTKIVRATLINGSITIKNVQLISKRPTITAKVIVKDSTTGLVLQDAHVRIYNVNGDKSANTLADGSASLFVFQDSIPYNIVVGKWGFRHKSRLYQSDKQNNTIVIELKRGYQDDFIFDQGWSVNSTATTGIWTREEPTGTVYRNEQFQPDLDMQNDFGTECYVTGNLGGDPSADDVDNGVTILTSPVMKLANYKAPVLSFYYWFVNAGGQGSPNDKMTVRLTNGMSTIVLKEINSHSPSWKFSDSIRFNSFITLTDSMRLIVDIADDQPGHLLDAGFDDFLLFDEIITQTSKLQNDFILEASPNPFHEQCQIHYQVDSKMNYLYLKIVDQFGKIVEQGKLQNNEGVLNLGSNYRPGFYTVSLNTEGSSKSVRIIKM
ncbi:MAG: choice-of-anchor B family protein [Saprospiraceae bacterium]|nr:choice-of-anchor B family protein [Saprospiraceae bacterium]